MGESSGGVGGKFGGSSGGVGEGSGKAFGGLGRVWGELGERFWNLFYDHNLFFVNL